MKKTYNFLPILVLVSIILSCQSKEEKRKLEITHKAYKIFFDARSDIRTYDDGRLINLDSLISIYGRLENENVDSALIFANKLKFIADSLRKAKAEIYKKAEIETQKKWEKSKAGKIFKENPYWTREDCEKLANGEIWIGMEMQMVRYIYGAPDDINVSNYGNGNQYQYCWHNRNPGCFYTDEDRIVKSYN